MNTSFDFNLPTIIKFGEGIVKSIDKIIKENIPGDRVFVVTDGGIEGAGLVTPIITKLKDSGYQIEVFNEISPNPKDVECEKGRTAIREFNADMILAIGGGSVIDTAKAIALLESHEGPIALYEGRNKATNEMKPIIAIPTTAGTGSEVTFSAVITDTRRKFKMSMRNVGFAPKIAIIDPETTYTLPRGLTASTGMDALVHAIEAFTCTMANAFSDVWAKEAIRYIFKYLNEAVSEGTQEFRYYMMLGSVMAGIAFSRSDVAAVHCMAEAVGGLYDIPHGVANSIFLPVVTEFNAEHNPARHAEIARICELSLVALSDIEASRLLVSELYKLSEGIGIPKFKDLHNVNPEDFDRLAEVSQANGSTPSNCRKITKSDYIDLFHKAYKL